MRAFHSLLAPSLLLLFSADAATLRGTVMADELGGPPVASVAARLPGLPEVRTDEQGHFEIALPPSVSGRSVSLDVSHPGRTVVHPAQLEILVPEDGDPPPALVLLTREPILDEMARRFFRLACESATRAKVSQLPAKERDAGSSSHRPSLREHDIAWGAADNLALEFVRVRHDQTSALYRAALNHFLGGRAEDALKSLNDDRLRELPRTAESDEAAFVECGLLKARILTTHFRFDDARRLHHFLVAEAPSSTSAWLGLARFEQSLHQPKESRQAFARALALARMGDPPESLAPMLVSLGHLHRESGQIDDALRYWREALALLRPTSIAFPDRHQAEMASLLNDLGNVQIEIGELPAARESYTEALGIYRSLTQRLSAAFAPNVAATQSNLGVLLGLERSPDEARHLLRDAIQAQRLLSQQNPAAHRQELARTLFNLGRLEQSQKRLAQAHAPYVEALALFRQMAEQQPTRFMGDVADTLNNLGLLHRDQGRIDEAIGILREALDAYQFAARDDPGRFQDSVQRVGNRLRELERYRASKPAAR